MFQIKMDKTPKQVTKHPKRHGSGKKKHIKKRLKESILNENQPSTSSSTNKSTTSMGKCRLLSFPLLITLLLDPVILISVVLV